MVISLLKNGTPEDEMTGSSILAIFNHILKKIGQVNASVYQRKIRFVAEIPVLHHATE